MKRLLRTVVLLALVGQSLAIDSAVVTFQEAHVNPNGLLTVTVKTDDTVYIIDCNQDQETCRIPSKHVTYILRDSAVRIYECQNVELVKNSASLESLGIYCLKHVE